MRRRRYGVAAAALGVSAGVHRVGAQELPPAARLQYLRGAGAERCPDTEAFRASVAERLGYDPFGGGASAMLSVRLERTAGTFTATIVYDDSSQPGSAAQRVLHTGAHGRQAECHEIAAAATLAVSLVIDTLVHTRPSVPSGVSSPPPALPVVPPRVVAALPAAVSPSPSPPPAPNPAAEPRVHGFVGIGVGLPLDVVPGVSVGPTLSAGARFDHLAVTLRGRLAPSFAQAIGGTPAGEFFTTVAEGLLSGCYVGALTPWLDADVCGTIGIGVLSGHAIQLDRTTAQSSPYVTLGATVGGEWRPWRAIGIAVEVDVMVPGTRIEQQVDLQGVRTTVWTTPALGVTPSVAGRFHFP